MCPTEMHSSLHACMLECICTHTHTHTQIRMLTHLHARTHTHVHMSTHACEHTQHNYHRHIINVCKISQYRNCCFECTRRPPYKVWSETCVNTCTECCFWHPWPSHPIKMTWEHFWNLGSSAVLVQAIPKWQDAVCCGWWFDVHTNTPCLWCSSGIGPQTCTIHPVFTTPAWCDCTSQLWLSQVRWWHRNLWQCTT